MGRCEDCRCYECDCISDEEAREFRDENAKLKARLEAVAVSLDPLYRGQWATNRERDELIDAAWAALELECTEAAE